MTDADRAKYLRIALMLTGLVFIFALWPLTIVWPSGWSWHAEGRSYYLEMILGLYATLGVFLVLLYLISATGSMMRIRLRLLESMLVDSLAKKVAADSRD
jgi:hypothetical protein